MTSKKAESVLVPTESQDQLPHEKQTSRYGGETKTKIISSSIGSMITALSVTPLEVVKVRQQAAGISIPTNTLNYAMKPCPIGCGTFVLSTGLGEYLTARSKAGYFDPKTGLSNQRETITEILETGGPIKILRKIFQTEGLAGIYAGLAPTLVMGIPNNVLYFFSYEEIAPRLIERYPIESPVSGMIPAVSGASARFIASLSTAPLELLRTQQAARAGSLSDSANGGGMIDEFRTIIRTEGFLSLFRGVWPTLMRDIPFSAIYWLSIESMRDLWKDRHRDQQHLSNSNRYEMQSISSISTIEQTVEAFINGFISGCIAGICTAPMDVLKTRSQVLVTPTVVKNANIIGLKGLRETSVICSHGGALAVQSKNIPLITNSTSINQGSNTAKSLSTLQTARNIVKTEGIAGLWRGNMTRCMKVAPACGIMIATYEAGKRLLESDK